VTSPYNTIEPVHPAVQDARDLNRLEQQARERPQTDMARALMLAPNLTIFQALLAGEAVPLSQLDERMFRRYGVRRAA
jgi:hypothetical protein